jgi:hypothetical protein
MSSLPVAEIVQAARARRVHRALVAGGIAHYDRSQHLPRVLPVGLDELTDRSPEGRRAVLRRLARALRAERMRGRAGHWSYDLNRHIALAQAFAAERRLLVGERRTGG